jgi:hypothetical protein
MKKVVAIIVKKIRVFRPVSVYAPILTTLGLPFVFLGLVSALENGGISPASPFAMFVVAYAFVNSILWLAALRGVQTNRRAPRSPRYQTLRATRFDNYDSAHRVRPSKAA